MPPTLATVRDTIGSHLRSRDMPMAASSCASTLSEVSIAQSGCIAPASTMVIPLSLLLARCHSVRTAAPCVARLLEFTRSIRGGIPCDRTMRPCSGSLFVARSSSAFAASRCAS